MTATSGTPDALNSAADVMAAASAAGAPRVLSAHVVSARALDRLIVAQIGQLHAMRDQLAVMVAQFDDELGQAEANGGTGTNGASGDGMSGAGRPRVSNQPSRGASSAQPETFDD